MGIGTSRGAFYENEAHYHAAQHDDRYDDNVIENAPFVPETRDQNIITPKQAEDNMRQNKQQRDMDKIENDLLGEPIAYKTDVPPDKGQPDLLDFTNYSNTPMDGDLGKETAGYFKWIGKQSERLGRDLDLDRYDYDMQGYYKKYGPVDLEKGEHFPDEFKKPNHPTFSTQSIYHGRDSMEEGDTTPRKLEGGVWDRDGDTYTFTPGETNLRLRSAQELIDYFKEYEPGAKLILPGQ